LAAAATVPAGYDVHSGSHHSGERRRRGGHRTRHRDGHRGEHRTRHRDGFSRSDEQTSIATRKIRREREAREHAANRPSASSSAGNCDEFHHKVRQRAGGAPAASAARQVEQRSGVDGGREGRAPRLWRKRWRRCRWR